MKSHNKFVKSSSPSHHSKKNIAPKIAAKIVGYYGMHVSMDTSCTYLNKFYVRVSTMCSWTFFLHSGKPERSKCPWYFRGYIERGNR